jgi:glycosyltransferase involved in cell wall biosynthesis
MASKNISVILAAFDGSKYIVKQLDSILTQTISPSEIIICDDNSADDTVALLQPYLADNRIKLFVNDSRLGFVNNFKKAATLAHPGNWLVFADQDDIWLPEKLGKLADAMALIDDGNTPSLIYSDLAIIDKDDALTSPSFWDKQKIRPGKIMFATLLYGNVALGCTMIINYAMANEFFLMDSNECFHDEWLALIAYSFGRVRVLNEPLVLYRQHASNVTFSEDYKTPGFIAQVKDSLSYLVGKKSFLPHQFSLAKAFLSAYQSKLSAKQLSTIQNFINQENKNYLLQRLNRKITYSRAVVN